MANSQLEVGYIPIVNELAEALARIRLSGEESQVLWVIIRMTYGWNRKQSAITLTQFVESTGILKTNVRRSIRKLLSKLIILINIDQDNTQVFEINKDYDQWRPLSKLIKLIKIDQKPLSKLITIHKDNLKTIYTVFFDTFWKTYPSRKGRKVGKKAAYENFQKIPEAEIESLLAATLNYAAEVDHNFAKDPERFLKKDFWRDWIKKDVEDDLDPMEIEYRRKYGPKISNGTPK